MYDRADLFGLNDTIGLIITILAIGSLILGGLSLVYAIRSWMAQSAAFQTRKDVAEIKQILQDIKQSTAPKAAPAPSKTDQTDGRHIAQN